MRTKNHTRLLIAIHTPTLVLISRKVRGQLKNFKVPLVAMVLLYQHTVSSRSCPLLASSSIRQTLIDRFDRSYIVSVGAFMQL